MPGTNTDLINGLSREQADRLMEMGESVSIAAGGVLFDLGDEAERVYQVVSGRVTLTLPLQLRGKAEDVLVEERLPGETLGWSGLIPPHRFTLKAAVPADSDLIAFSRADLLTHFAGDPQVAFVVTRNVASVVAHRLQVFQAMWLREMQRVIELRYS